MLKLCYCRIDSNLLILMTHALYPEQCYHEDIDEDDDCDEYDGDGYKGEQAYSQS